MLGTFLKQNFSSTNHGVFLQACTITRLLFPTVLWPKTFVILPSANILVFLKKLCLWAVISDSKSLICLNVWGMYCNNQLHAPSTVKMAAYNIGKGYYKHFPKFCFVVCGCLFVFQSKTWLHWLIRLIELWINVVWAGPAKQFRLFKMFDISIHNRWHGTVLESHRNIGNLRNTVI